MANSYRTSTGERYTQPEIENKVREAKKELRQKCLDEHGYIFCHTCKRNDCVPVDCAHLVSVKEAKETGHTELCWDINNIILEGRKCHAKRDKLNIQFTNQQL